LLFEEIRCLLGPGGAPDVKARLACARQEERVRPKPGENTPTRHRDALVSYPAFCILEAGEYHRPMLTPGFRRTLEAGLWFVVGFIVHWALVHFHNHP
jgi:hypothetical protein